MPSILEGILFVRQNPRQSCISAESPHEGAISNAIFPQLSLFTSTSPNLAFEAYTTWSNICNYVYLLI
jgi:hypothetical protein